MTFWPEEIGQQVQELGEVINMEHWLPKPLITGEITIMQKAMEIYNDRSILLKLNKMRMYYKIIYLSEIGEEVQFYNHHIRFPEVKKNNGLVYFWNKFKKEINVNLKGEQYCGRIKHVKWWKCDRWISDGNVTYELVGSRIYKKVEFKRVSRQSIVRIRMMKNDRMKLLNEFVIDHKNKRDPLMLQVASLEQFQNSKKIKLYTDAGVYTTSGKATYSIIIGDGRNKVEIKIRLLDLDPCGTTTGEMMSITVGLHMMKKAQLFDAEVIVYNDNKDAVKAVNTQPNLKEAIGANGQAKCKIWEEVKAFKDIRAEWSKDDSTRIIEEHVEVLKEIKRCYNIAYKEMMDCAFEEKELGKISD